MFSIEAVGGVLFVIVGVAMLALAIRGLRIGIASRKWPATGGEILESRVEEESDEGSIRYVAKVKYRYCVGGREFTADEITFKAYAVDEKSAEATVARYPVGSRPQVHYDPRRPDHAVLEPGTSPGVVAILIVFLLAYSAFGVAMVLGFID